MQWTISDSKQMFWFHPQAKGSNGSTHYSAFLFNTWEAWCPCSTQNSVLGTFSFHSHRLLRVAEQMYYLWWWLSSVVHLFDSTSYTENELKSINSFPHSSSCSPEVTQFSRYHFIPGMWNASMSVRLKAYIKRIWLTCLTESRF